MPRLLLLEDDRSLIDGLTYSLEKNGFETEIAGTVKEAEKRVTEDTGFDLLLFDVMLPDGNGIALCEKLRSLGIRTPIIFLTASDEETSVIRGLDCGGDDYITKPFSLMVLRARIRALLRRNIGEQQSEYRHGIFQFCFDTMEFYKEGNSIELSKTEQRILYLLVFNAGQILTRERLLEWVWPDGTEYVEDNALSVGIRRLRDKLEDVPSKPVYIKTVYGKGYMWERF